MTPPLAASDLSDPGSTASSLIERVQAADEDAWRRLTDLYGPLVYRWARRVGVPAADSADVMQEVFQAVAGGIGEFRGKRAGNRFRGWLRAITRNKANDYFRRRQGGAQAVGGTDFQLRLAELADAAPESSASAIDRSDRRWIIRQLLAAVRVEFQPHTWQAFWRAAIDGQPATDVADELGMTANAVRQAKFRVLRRLREEFDDAL